MGESSQLDVTVSENIGSVPIFIPFECKQRGNEKPVPMEKVEAFATKLKDVDANAAVMISNTGFDAGARAVAAQHNILLKTYREADETDWKRLVGADCWMTLIGSEWDIIRVSVVLANGQRIDDVPPAMILFNEHGEHYKVKDGEPWTVYDLFSDGWEQAPRPREIGHVEFTLGLAKQPIFVSFHGQILPTHSFIIEAEINPKQYEVNPNLVKGELLETTDTKKAEYIRTTIERFNASEIMAKSKGKALAKEEWKIEETKRKLEFRVDPDVDYHISIEAKLK